MPFTHHQFYNLWGLADWQEEKKQRERTYTWLDRETELKGKPGCSWGKGLGTRMWTNNQLPKQKSHSWPSRNSQISDAKNKRTKKQINNPTHTTVLTTFVFAVIPIKDLKKNFFLNQCNAVGTMQRKCTQKTETGARLCPGRTSEAGLTERWLACVGTCIPCAILPPRPLGGSTISLHLQFVQHLRDETKTHQSTELQDQAGVLGAWNFCAEARPRAVPHLFR